MEIQLDKRRLFFIKILLITLIILGHCVSEKCSEDKSPLVRKKSLCLTPNCVKIASRLLNAMNSSVDPCEDFYEYACGGFMHTHPVHKDSISIYTEFMNEHDNQIETIIQNMDITGQPDIVLKAKKFYEYCLPDYIRDLYFNRNRIILIDFLNNHLGGWPILSKNWHFNGSKEIFIAKALRLGLSQPFFDFEITQPLDDLNSNYIAIYKNPLKTLRKQIFRWLIDVDETKIILETAEFLRRYSGMYNIVSYSEGTCEANKIMSLSSKIDKLKSTKTYTRGKREKWIVRRIKRESPIRKKKYFYDHGIKLEELTIGELNNISFQHEFNWLEVLNTLFDGIHTFNEDDKILADTKYIKELTKVLVRKSFRSIANYAVWSIIKEALPHVSEKAKLISDKLEFKPKTQVEQCVEWIRKDFVYIITKLYINKYVDPSTKRKVEEMINLIQEGYKKNIQRSKWLNSETKTKAIEKINSMKKFVGYPDFILNNEEFQNYYNFIPEPSPSHIRNFLNIKKGIFRKTLRQYKNPDIEYNWENDNHLLMFNAFYRPSKNSITFPLQIFQFPLFDDNRPMAVNFALIGWIIGHEIGHAFHQTDKKAGFGHIENLWKKNMIKQYVEKTNCYLKQYNEICSSFSSKDCGNRTLDEDLPDNTAIRVAFEAYKMWVKKHGKEKRLPGLEMLSPEQIFFLSYGYGACKNDDTNDDSDVHSPGRNRVIGPLSNFHEFSRVFHCPEGKMNRGIQRCEFW